MSVRLRRLQSDYDRLCTLLTQNSRIRIKKTLNAPPDKYQLEYLVGGLEKTIEGQLRNRNNFLVEITLTGSYPRMAPQCRMLTPVFHPNIAPHAICIGDHWAAGEALANLVIRIAEMLSYQSYNLKSPLNGEAAKWAEENKGQLPLDTFDFSSLLSIGEAVGRGTSGELVAGAVCANCGKHDDAQQMRVCVNMHTACPACVTTCPICNAVLCLKCPQFTCALCKKAVCPKCGLKCGACGQNVCSQHAQNCCVCQRTRCTDCMTLCGSCRKPVCLDHVVKRKTAAGTTSYACQTCNAAAIA